MAKKCMKCGGAMKMAKGGSVSKPFAAGIPYATGAGATDGKNGMMKKGGAVKKMADGGPIPRKVRTAVTSPSGDYKSITTTKNNPQKKSSKSTSNVRRTLKGVINNAPTVKAAERPMMQKNGGTVKKMADGGVVKNAKLAALAAPKNKITRADVIVGAKRNAKKK